MVEVLGPSQHQARQETGRLDFSLQALGRAVVQAQVHVNRIASRLLGQQCQLDTLDRVGTLDARLDSQGRDVERLAHGLKSAALVVLDQLGHVGSGWHGSSLGLGTGDEVADGSVAGSQIPGGNLLDLRRGDFLDAITAQEIEPPVALRTPVGELDRDAVGVGGGEFAILEQLLAGSIDFLPGDAVACHVVEH